MREYVLYKVDVALRDRKHEKEANGETFTTILRMTYKEGRGHFNIFLDRIEKVSDFKKVMQILVESDSREFDHNADIVKEYLTLVFDTVVSLRKEKEGYNDDESKKTVMNCDTLIKRYKGFADAFNKICFDPDKKITLESAPEVPTAKKDSYYIMIFDKAAHKCTLKNVFGFSFVFNGFKVGVHKTQNGKMWTATLVGYGIPFGLYEKSKKAAIYSAIDTLKKCNFSPSKMGDAAARFASVAAECNIDISDQIKPPTTEETATEPTEPETVVTPVESPTAAETEPLTEPHTPAETEPLTEPHTPAETATEPTEPPTAAEDPETAESRHVCSFTPLSPGERHAAAITPENAAPPLMVVIWIYCTILYKRLFNTPTHAQKRLLYAAGLLLHCADYSGLLYGLPLLNAHKIVTPGDRATTPKTQYTKADTRRRARLECKKLETYRNNYVILKPFDTS
jgi:hypothetical protein